MRAGRLHEALAFAERAVEGVSRCVPAHGMLATILLHLGRITDAETTVCEALKHRQGTADAYDALAHVSMLLGEYERSNALYRRVVQIDPKEPRFGYNLASSERSFGRLVDAEVACDHAIALGPTHYATYLLRSELRIQTQEANHVDELRGHLSDPALPARARVVLGYALGKELDDLQRFDEAFHWFAKSADSRRRQLAYNVAADEFKLARISEVFPAARSENEKPTQDSSRYIFIVGLPRSGTTLVEHILTALSGVRSNGETENFSRALISAAPHGSGDLFVRSAAADANTVAANYSRFADRRAGDQKVIEKLPMNYLYLGAIRRALPSSKILLVKRQVIDSCFAMYRTLFDGAYPFSYDFEDLARYYVAYDNLVRHWRKCFGDTMFEVDYESLVRDPGTVGAGIAAYCDVQWVPAAIEVHKSASVSFTASAAQIRRPIYGTSSGRWRHYRAHLGPLVKALQLRGVPLPHDA